MCRVTFIHRYIIYLRIPCYCVMYVFHLSTFHSPSHSLSNSHCIFSHLSLPLALLFIPISPSPLLHYPAHVAALVVCPTEVLQVSLRDFVFHFVSNQDLPEEADDSWEAQEKIAQALLARRKMLGGFLKLVMYRNIDLVHAAPIFAQYMRVSEGTQYTECGVWDSHTPSHFHRYTHTHAHTHTHTWYISTLYNWTPVTRTPFRARNVS